MTQRLALRFIVFSTLALLLSQAIQLRSWSDFLAWIL